MNLWHALLEQAIDGSHVVDIAQDYVASLSPDDLAAVPRDCRPTRIAGESDVDHWNVCLADECRNLWGTERDGRMLTDMSQFFLRASVRLSRIYEQRIPKRKRNARARSGLHA